MSIELTAIMFATAAILVGIMLARWEIISEIRELRDELKKVKP